MAESRRSEEETVLELLNKATQDLRKAGVEEPRLNAEVLLARALGVGRSALYARYDEAVIGREREEFGRTVSLRAARWPLQYLTGQCEFYGRSFIVTRAVMVPRQETETLVEECLDKIPADGAGWWALDIGTGSGAIAVTLAAERQALHLMGTDVDPDALAVAERNALAHVVAGRIEFVMGELAGPAADRLPAGREKFDLVVSNPPYIQSGQIQHLQPEVGRYEPMGALDGGPDGLSVVRELIPAAAGLLTPGGWLAVEIGEGQSEAVTAIIEQEAAFDSDSIQIRKDGQGCDRVIACALEAWRP